MNVPTKVLELVERFDRNLEPYKQGKYNETQVRLEFINPFFEELGWDVANKQGYAEAYKEVVHEDAVKVGGATKAPDYSFRVGGVRKFFLEAKKPSVDIRGDTHPAYQLRRYAWSAKLPLSILTDFEELAVYDCRVKPVKTDKASHSRVLYLTYTDYAKRWDEIVGVFSREAILKGSFDKYVESKKTKRGTAEVDAAFLQEIERWRDLLARNIALRNPNLSQRELNFAVQRTIDRIIFLRICEDRGIEFYGKLMALQNGTRIYQRLFQLFRQADNRYNSGLFHFRPEKERPDDSLDRLTPDLSIDDRALKDILKNLYYPDSPYEFSVLPANILGQVYEQFLGKVIRLTPAHHAVVEDKPEVRKAGGVYYTPTYIVDYIVKQTVGKLVEGKKPGPRGAVSKLKILDPACGSGSFLLGAYQFLLDWHRDEYIKDGPEKWATGRTPRLYQTGADEWKLTTEERKRILLNNIYGVDIDPQAVEVTKLSLLLKVLEGEDEQTIAQQLALFHQRVLPDLANNIKCGNSLIGPDFYEGQQVSLLDEGEMYRLNVFDWNSEFSEIMKNGGFDAVIGNPPYISIESTSKDVAGFYLKAYESAYGRVNAFSLFVEKAMVLLRNDGHCGLITSNRILTNSQLASLRKMMLEKTKIENILTFQKTVFKAAVDTTVITFQKSPLAQEHSIGICYEITDLARREFQVNKVQRSTFLANDGHVFNVKQQEKFMGIIGKVQETSRNLERFCDVKDGIILGTIKDLFLSDCAFDDTYEKWLEGNEVSRYTIEWTGRYICYDHSLIEEEMKRKREKAKKKAISALDFKKLSRSGIWLRNPRVFKQKKILTRQNAKRLIGAFDEKNYFVKNSLHCILLKDKTYNLKYILGLINSRLMDFYFQNQIGNTGEIFSQMKIAYVKKLPIRPIDFTEPSDKALHGQMVKLVDRILALCQQLAEARIPQAKTVLQRQIETTDRQIDELVYELYGLTDEEIKIVEKSLG